MGAQATPASGERIQDNSFLLEEAYNQEPGRVQHITSLSRFWGSKDWVFTWTEEWPAPRYPRHQFGFTVAVMRSGDFIGHGAGIGDFALNYRYQLIGSAASRFALAPRISALLPSGRPQLGRGTGGAGVQVGLPFSFTPHPRLSNHLNAGITYTPHARTSAGSRASLVSYGLAHSVVYAVHPRLNLMIESVWSSSGAPADSSARRVDEVLISPGVRWAHNFPGGLQIVPGVAVPVGAGPSAGERGVIVYLSFEYDLWHGK